MDRRERILNRVWELLQTMPGVESCVRNRGLLADEQRPALVLLDGDEGVDPRFVPRSGRGSLTVPPSVMLLRPEVFYLLKNREPQNVDVGQDLSAARRTLLPLLIPAVTQDSILASLVGSNGSIQYEGCLTDMATGRSMEGQLQFQFVFAYVLNLTELAQGA
jgi:hypothetical protein